MGRRLLDLQRRVRETEQRFAREPNSVRLLAVSKQQSLTAIRSARRLGLMDFGENHLQPALEKMDILNSLKARWHFIGAIQSRKAKQIARRFDWVHGLDRLDIAHRLNEARAEDLPRLPVCVQVQIGHESEKKSGIKPEAVLPFLEKLVDMTRLHVCGLMTLPARLGDFDAQRRQFAQLRACKERACEAGFGIEELSMGMSGDFEAAIAEGATWIRIGTALFGPRA